MLYQGIRRRLEWGVKTLADHSGVSERLARLEQRLDALESAVKIVADLPAIIARFVRLEKRLEAIGLDQVRGRLDFRLIRLEMLLHYQNKERYDTLDAESKKILAFMEDEYFDYGGSDRVYPLDVGQPRRWVPNYAWSQIDGPVPPPVSHAWSKRDGIWCVDFHGVSLHISADEEHARYYWSSIVDQESPGSPHIYIEENSSDFTFPDNAVLADVGGAEGFFAAKYLDRIAKAYIFEPQDYWVGMLRKTYERFADKVEIVPGMVGDQPGQIHLDEFFANRPKPTFVKMDVEGAEGSVLRSMSGMIQDKTLPMQLGVCLYHRQEDQAAYTAMLKDHFDVRYSRGYYWHMPDPRPPFFRRGVLRATRK
jgi:hypothetical protein